MKYIRLTTTCVNTHKQSSILLVGNEKALVEELVSFDKNHSCVYYEEVQRYGNFTDQDYKKALIALIDYDNKDRIEAYFLNDDYQNALETMIELKEKYDYVRFEILDIVHV